MCGWFPSHPSGLQQRVRECIHSGILAFLDVAWKLLQLGLVVKRILQVSGEETSSMMARSRSERSRTNRSGGSLTAGVSDCTALAEIGQAKAACAAPTAHKAFCERFRCPAALKAEVAVAIVIMVARV